MVFFLFLLFSDKPEVFLPDDISSGINNNECALPIFVDLRKAFDSVHQSILQNMVLILIQIIG